MSIVSDITERLGEVTKIVLSQPVARIGHDKEIGRAHV